MGAWIEIFFTKSVSIPCIVAPLVGAWIEISLLRQRHQIFWSLPLWERGLKFSCSVALIIPFFVAPLVGAWIEIDIKSRFVGDSIVAPLVGAWIEIY